MNKLSIRWKLALLASFASIVLLALTSFLLWQQYQGSYNDRKTSIRQAVEVAASIVESAYNQEKAGQLTKDQAQALAIKAVNDARYSGKEYFWINDLNVKLITHPFRPDLNGKDVSGVKDPGPECQPRSGKSCAAYRRVAVGIHGFTGHALAAAISNRTGGF